MRSLCILYLRSCLYQTNSVKQIDPTHWRSINVQTSLQRMLFHGAPNQEKLVNYLHLGVLVELERQSLKIAGHRGLSVIYFV